MLFAQLAVGKLHEHSVILTIKIPSIQSSRKVKVCLDETVGELMRSVKINLHGVHILTYMYMNHAHIVNLFPPHILLKVHVTSGFVT